MGRPSMSGIRTTTGIAGTAGKNARGRPPRRARAVLKDLLADQFGLSTAVLGDKVFPASAAVKPMANLVA
jgi:uncharacterized protein (DUF1501 family)